MFLIVAALLLAASSFATILASIVATSIALASVSTLALLVVVSRTTPAATTVRGRISCVGSGGLRLALSPVRGSLLELSLRLALMLRSCGIKDQCLSESGNGPIVDFLQPGIVEQSILEEGAITKGSASRFRFLVLDFLEDRISSLQFHIGPHSYQILHDESYGS